MQIKVFPGLRSLGGQMTEQTYHQKNTFVHNFAFLDNGCIKQLKMFIFVRRIIAGLRLCDVHCVTRLSIDPRKLLLDQELVRITARSFRNII